MLVGTCCSMSDGEQEITEEQIDNVIKSFRGTQGHIRADIGRKKREKTD